MQAILVVGERNQEDYRDQTLMVGSSRACRVKFSKQIKGLRVDPSVCLVACLSIRIRTNLVASSSKSFSSAFLVRRAR